MTPETRAARDRIAAFTDAWSPAAGDAMISMVGLGPDGSTVELRHSDLLAMLDATAEPPIMHAVSGLCTSKICGHAERAEIYRMIGTCANCHGGPFLMLFTVGHERHALNCPACGTQNLRASRLATADEIGTPATSRDESEQP